MSALLLKLIACVTMLFDHVGLVFGGQIEWLWIFRIVGRIAFPIFAFQLAVGYTKTHNLFAYYFRLLVFALVSQLPFYLMIHCGFVKTLTPDMTGAVLQNAYLGGAGFNMAGLSLNILFTLVMGLLAITVYDRVRSAPIPTAKRKETRSFYRFLNFCLGIVAVLPLLYIAQRLNMDYGARGVLLILAFYIGRKHKWSLALAMVLYTLTRLPALIGATTAMDVLWNLGQLLALVPILLYTGKQGSRKGRFVFYTFYPVHMALLIVLYAILV